MMLYDASTACTRLTEKLRNRESLLPRSLKGITEDDDEEEDSKAADEAEITGQAAPDKLRAELQRRKKEAEQ